MKRLGGEAQERAAGAMATAWRAQLQTVGFRPVYFQKNFIDLYLHLKHIYECFLAGKLCISGLSERGTNLSFLGNDSVWLG